MRIQEGGDPVGPGADPVTAVIARMEQVSTALPPRDGVRAFDQMYLETTRQVDAAIRGQQFADPVFMARLDVVFAGLFLGVWDRYATGPAAAAQVPRCWRGAEAGSESVPKNMRCGAAARQRGWGASA